MTTTHQLEPTLETLVGAFDRDDAPILTIASGDAVRYRTLDAGWGIEPPHLDWTERRKLPKEGADIHGHCLVGPLAIAGAKPGMTLAIDIERIVPGDYGFTFAGGWPHPVNRRLGLLRKTSRTLHLWQLDAATMRGRSQLGYSVVLRPFMGVMGCAPAEPGRHSTVPPRRTGGNIDLKELVAGTRLYLPIEVEGALFSVGDGHAAQGDGEVSVTAIECPMQEVVLRFTLLDEMTLTFPRVWTPEGWLTLGFHRNLQEACNLALEGMVDLIGARHALARVDALALASVTVDMRITQIVNKVRGVHAFLPHNAITQEN